MPPSGDETRRKLRDAATRAFAEHGVFRASLLDITRQAGQRNRAALHYHFGSRQRVLCAVLEPHVDFLAHREAELLDRALVAGGREVAPVVEAIVRPAAELAASGWRGSCFLSILAELVEEDQGALDAGVKAALERTGGYAVYEELAARMPSMPEAVRVERFALATSFILRAVADRAAATRDRRRPGREQLPEDAFVDNLVAMVAAMLCAPVADP